MYHALATVLQCASGKILADLGRTKPQKEAVVGKRGKVHFEAKGALLALPTESTTSMFVLSPFQWFVVSQGSVSNDGIWNFCLVLTEVIYSAC